MLEQPTKFDMFSLEALDTVEQIMVMLARGERLEYTGSMVQEHLETGGKRLRARLALASTDALGGNVHTAVHWAAAVELLHNATLIHDDIQDGDMVRRGQPTTWVNHGKAQAINAGDLMLMLPFLSLSRMNCHDKIRWLLSWRLADQAAQTVRGQVEELEIMKSQTLTRDSYFRAVRGKTGGFFALPVEGGALLAGIEEKEALSLGACFLELGTLFQIQDDILDLYGNKGRALQGADIYEGKPSILVLNHLEIHPEESQIVWDILSKPRLQTDEKEVLFLIKRFEESGALAASIADIQKCKAELFSQDILYGYPKLFSLLKNMVQLALKPIEKLL